jgi:hypothetical protein
MHTDKPHDQSHDKESIKALCQCHKDAISYHEAACKCHHDAIKSHEAGDHKAAAVCSDKAQEHSNKAALADKACCTQAAKLQSAIKK